MDPSITAHFYGSEPAKQTVKTIMLLTSETKSLTTSLEKFQKEVNTYLTECIEKNTATNVENSQINVNEEEEGLEESDDEESESNLTERPNKLPKLL